PTKIKHLLDNANSSDSEATPPVKKAKLEAIEAILNEFEPIKDVSFEPFKYETLQPTKATLSPDFPATAKPYDYFTLFFTPTFLQIITSNTNRYANLQRIRVKQERSRQWRKLLVEELFVFIKILVYMGIHEEPRIDMYWNTDKKRSPIHTISAYIALNRYKEIKKYCHISNPENDERLSRHLPTNTIWWYKIKLLYYSPSSEVSINELIVRCFSRSSYTYKMPSKPINSRAKGLQALFKHPQLTPTGSLVRSLLRKCGYSAISTTRPHSQLPTNFKQDNNIILALSNIHTVHQTNDFKTKIRKRPTKTLTNSRIVRQIFKEDYTKELHIPRFIDNYNHHIRRVDLANQFREAYKTYRTTQRNWWPLFY
ncbi:hypothetical protein DL98DRAFT_518555, partial [Cadophora sp. DSE1049]